jgi:hypothetical protein
MAQGLREALKAKSIALTHGESRELMAKTFGFCNWKVLSAAIQKKCRRYILKKRQMWSRDLKSILAWMKHRPSNFAEAHQRGACR